MKRILETIVVAAALVALFGCGGGPESIPDEEVGEASRDVLAEALAAANAAERPLLIDVYADW